MGSLGRGGADVSLEGAADSVVAPSVLGLSFQLREGRKIVDVKTAVTVNKAPDELYRYWHDFAHLPQFMDHLESVQVVSAQRSHWKAKAPAGTTVEWDADIVDDRPNEVIAWRSVEGAAVRNEGSVRFTPAPGGRGTEVRVEMRYDVPGGALGATIAKLFGEEPGQQARDDLRCFKQVMETGEKTMSEATASSGAAQPPEDGSSAS